MNKTIVIYKSKSGYTKTYAEWIAQELECELKEASKLSVNNLIAYDQIIYGAGLYACGINGISLIKKNLPALKEKRIIVWATGSNPGRPEEMKQVWEYNFSPEELAQIKTFYLRGGFDYQKLGAVDKALMSMLKLKLKSKKDLTEDEQGMLNAYSVAEYHCSKDKIQELIEYAQA